MYDLNFCSLEVVSRCRDSQLLQVSKNYLPVIYVEFEFKQMPIQQM